MNAGRTWIGLTLGCLALTPALGQGSAIPPHPNERYLREWAQELSAEAQRAANTASFAERNAIHARAVTAESADLAARALHLDSRAQRDAIERTFAAATLEAGARFGPAFHADGTYDPAQEQAKKAAQNAAGSVARAYGPALVAALDGRPIPTAADQARLDSVLSRARFEDVARIMDPTVGSTLGETEGERLREAAKTLVPAEDWSRSMLEELPTRQPGEQPLRAEELKVLEAQIRLANATWKAGQVHRAVAENNPGRISITRAGNYAPFDLMQYEVYSRAAEESTRHLSERGGMTGAQLATQAARNASARATFEVYKDFHEAKQGGTEDPAERAARLEQVQKQLSRTYVQELRGMTFAELRAEAKALGVELPEGRFDRKELARTIWDAVLPEQARTVEASAPAPARQGAAERLGELVPREARGRRVRGR
ncbi:MAG: hypothetical protein R3F62_26275 [Planctomycetota bacterium]